MSQSGTFYKIIVTYLLIGISRSTSQDFEGNPLLYRYAPSIASSGSVEGALPTGRGAVGNTGFGEDGAIASSFQSFAPRSQYFQSVSPESYAPDVLQTAAQTYFIEPAQPTTTTKRPTFKKRKTRRPITSLAQKKKPVEEGDNANEVSQGSPVPFNPFRQIVNTSFGRKRPSEGSSQDQHERSRSRANAKNENANGANDGINEIPSSSTEGEPRALSRRRPAQEVRAVRPSSDDANEEPIQKSRFIPRKPVVRINPESNGARPRNFAKRPRTSTTAAPEDSADTTNSISQPQLKRTRPFRAGGGSRFAPAKISTSVPESESSPVPQIGVKRRPLRPTNAPSTEIPTEGNIISTTTGSDVPQRPLREGRQGFILRPRPAPQTQENNINAGQGEDEVATSKPLNRRRKRPTNPSSPKELAGAFDSHANAENVQNIPPRRIPSALRSRPVPFSSLSTGGQTTHQVQNEQPIPHSIGHVGPTGNTEEATPSSQANLSLLRRPSNPISPSAPTQPNFNDGLDTANFVPGLFPVPQENLEYYPGRDNVVGFPSNFRSIQQRPRNGQFSSRINASEEPAEISDSDTTLGASTERQTTVVDPSVDNKSEAEVKKPGKLSPLDRLHNRQAAARRLLTPRKPTEKTTPAPAVVSQASKHFRKSLIPPRMLRSRGKSQEQDAANEPSANPGSDGEQKAEDSTASGTVKQSGIINEPTVTGTDTEHNVVPINSDNEPQLEEKVTSKPSILDNAKRRRLALPGKSATTQLLKITPAPPPDHNPDAPPPDCEAGQRYSKFLKRCVTMYQPKAQG